MKLKIKLYICLSFVCGICSLFFVSCNAKEKKQAQLIENEVVESVKTEKETSENIITDTQVSKNEAADDEVIQTEEIANETIKNEEEENENLLNECEVINGELYYAGEKYVSFGDSMDDVVKKMGQTDLFEQSPGSYNWYYEKKEIGIFFNHDDEKVYSYSFYFSDNEKKSYALTKLQSVKIDGLVIKNTETYLDFCNYLKENNYSFEVGESNVYFFIRIKSDNRIVNSIRFLKRYDGKISGIQYYQKTLNPHPGGEEQPPQ